jgi:hypothetical protein
MDFDKNLWAEGDPEVDIPEEILKIDDSDENHVLYKIKWKYHHGNKISPIPSWVTGDKL